MNGGFFRFLKLVAGLAAPVGLGVLLAMATGEAAWIFAMAGLEFVGYLILAAVRKGGSRENYSEGLTYEEYVEKYGKPRDKK